MNRKKYLNLTILAFGACMIYTLPYLRYVLYEPLQTALGLDHTQFGFTMTSFGIFATLTYLPGGWLADRISPRKLLSFSYVSTGLLGFWLAAYPPYWACVVIHGAWGVTTSLTFWAALIRATKDLAASDEQGRFFGLLESGRGLFSTAVSFFSVWLFALFAAPAVGIYWTIIALSAFAVLAGLVTFLAFRDPVALEPSPSVLKDFGRTVKSPLVWALALIIFTAYIARCMGSFMTPYLTNMLMLSAAVTGVLATTWNYVGQLLGAPAGGFAADKIGSRALVVAAGFAVMTVAWLALAAIPKNPAFAVLSVCLIILMFLCLFVVRGVYFALLDDMRVPPEISGSAIGFASLVGFTPEIFAYAIGGGILDKYQALGRPEDGYQMLFLVGAASVAVGLIVSVLVLIKIRRDKNAAPAVK